MVLADPQPRDVARGFVPGFEGTESVLLAVGILGATVMPHVIYLHSALTQHRLVGATEEAKRRIFRSSSSTSSSRSDSPGSSTCAC